MDLFYDASQDVPLPSDDGGRTFARGRGRGQPSVCESCNAAIPPEDLARGTATEVYGLALCAACRAKTRAEERIELYFCDRCHVSVPVYRVDTGEALQGDGRILCLDCRERAHRFRGLQLAGMLVLLLMAGTAGAFLLRGGLPAELSEKSYAPATESSPVLSVDDDEPRLADLVAGVSSDLQSVVAGLDSLETTRDEIYGKLTQAETLVQKTREEFSLRMRVLQDEAESLKRQLERTLDQSGPIR